MDGKRKRVLVLGLGPVGGIFSACLSAAGHAVSGIDIWEEHVARIRADGLRITGIDEITARFEEVQTSVAALKNKSFDYVVIALKASVMSRVIPDLLEFGGDFMVVALQNGIDNEEILGEHFGRHRTMRIVVNYAGVVVEPGRLQMTFFNRPNYVGCLCAGGVCAHARELASILTRAGLDTDATDDLKKSVWRKTILNAALTPVCSLLDMTMAQVMACRETYQLVEAILTECLSVAGALGHEFGESFLSDSLGYLSRAGDHRPSMAADLKRGLPTEIDFLNGQIMSHGLRLGVPVPINSALVALMKALEKKNLDKERS